MSQFVIRRTVAVVGAAAVLALGVGGGSAVAAPASATVSSDNVKVTKTVTPGSVGRGATVTYTSVFEVTNATDRRLNKITDVHPAGFEYVPGSAKITASGLFTGPSTNPVTPELDDAGNRLSVSGTWLLTDRPTAWDKDVTFEVTYRVPAAAGAGTFDSGLAFDVATWGASQVFDPMGVNVSVEARDIATATVLSGPGTATVGTAVSLEATVAPAPGGGTVQFTDGDTAIGGPVKVVDGRATLTHTFDTVGEHEITAEFSGSDRHAASTSKALTTTVSLTDEGAGGGNGSAGSIGSLFAS